MTVAGGLPPSSALSLLTLWHAGNLEHLVVRVEVASTAYLAAGRTMSAIGWLPTLADPGGPTRAQNARRRAEPSYALRRRPVLRCEV